MSSDVILLSRFDVAALMTPFDYRNAVETAFRASKEGRAFAPVPMEIPASGGGFHAKGASFATDRNYVAMKFNGNFPDNPKKTGLSTIQGAILLCDGEQGSVLAIMDSIEVTLMRTAAASAIAAEHLARSDTSTLCICGCGDQGRVQAAALAEVVPIRNGFAWDIDASKAISFAAQMTTSLGVPFEATAALRDVSRKCGVIVTCTTSQAPFLTEHDVAPGTFVAAVGADNPEKSEVTPALLAKSKIVVDVLEQCLVMGDLHHAIEVGAVSATEVFADLGDIVVGARPGRTDDEEIFVFDSTGTAIQDAASAALIYRRALETGAGVRFAL